MSIDNDRLLSLIGQGDTLKALQALQSATVEEPRLVLNRALYLPGSADAAHAIGDAQQATQAHLSDPDAHDRAAALYNLGCFSLMQDDVLEARQRFGEVLDLEPDNRMARHNLAYAHELLAETEDARREYEGLLRQHRDSGLTRLNLAQLHLQEGDYEDGLESLETLFREMPDNMGVLLYLSRGLLLRGTSADLERVLELLDAAEAAGEHRELVECRAYAVFLQGDHEGAEEAFRQLLEGDAESLFALSGLLKVLAQQENLEALPPLVQRYHALSPSPRTKALLADLAQD